MGTLRAMAERNMRKEAKRAVLGPNWGRSGCMIRRYRSAAAEEKEYVIHRIPFLQLYDSPMATIAMEDMKRGTPWQEWANWHSHSVSSSNGHLWLQRDTTFVIIINLPLRNEHC